MHWSHRCSIRSNFIVLLTCQEIQFGGPIEIYTRISTYENNPLYSIHQWAWYMSHNNEHPFSTPPTYVVQLSESHLWLQLGLMLKLYSVFSLPSLWLLLWKHSYLLSNLLLSFWKCHLISSCLCHSHSFKDSIGILWLLTYSSSPLHSGWNWGCFHLHFWLLVLIFEATTRRYTGLCRPWVSR